MRNVADFSAKPQRNAKKKRNNQQNMDSLVRCSPLQVRLFYVALT